MKLSRSKQDKTEKVEFKGIVENVAIKLPKEFVWGNNSSEPIESFLLDKLNFELSKLTARVLFNYNTFSVDINYPDKELSTIAGYTDNFNLPIIFRNNEYFFICDLVVSV